MSDLTRAVSVRAARKRKFYQFFGEKALKKELLEQMSGRLGTEHYGQERQETSLAKAERIVAEELRKRRWDEKHLEKKPKGDVEKVKMAERLRRETTMTLAWIAERLRMGTKTHLAHLLYWQKREEKKSTTSGKAGGM